METGNTPPKISMDYVYKYLLGTFNLEKGLFYTIRELTLRPGKAIRSFLFTEERKRFMRPLSFLLLMVTIGTFLSFQINTHFENERMDYLNTFAADLNPHIDEIEHN